MAGKRSGHYTYMLPEVGKVQRRMEDYPRVLKYYNRLWVISITLKHMDAVLYVVPMKQIGNSMSVRV